MDQLTFGQYGAAFKPNRTKFDWLSRDEAEVDKYVADERCGNVFTSGFFVDLLGGLGAINSRLGRQSRVPKDLPVHLVSGSLDPVGAKGERRPAGRRPVPPRSDCRTSACKLWPEARHEVLNETNRDEVMDEVVDWLDAHLPAAD